MENCTFCLENVKQGMLMVLKKRFPTISAAVVLAILRQERNLSSQLQCITVWILTLVRPYLVCPGSMLIGHPRSWWRQQRSAPLYPPMLLALSTRHPFPHQAVPGILITERGEYLNTWHGLVPTLEHPWDLMLCWFL